MVHHSIAANHYLIAEMKRNFPQYNFKANGRVKDRLDRDIKKGLLAECAYSINNNNITGVDLQPKKFGDGGVDFTNNKYEIDIDRRIREGLFNFFFIKENLFFLARCKFRGDGNELLLIDKKDILLTFDTFLCHLDLHNHLSPTRICRNDSRDPPGCGLQLAIQDF